ncbi:hypothetical protein [Flavobacterium sp.]|uniref:hypothetical protein n=1 Tax=Flavobacterium sp. TaxID=239 RepID=UPI00261E1047|nr:hypothetical protein [Flavobacterium sp.]
MISLLISAANILLQIDSSTNVDNDFAPGLFFFAMIAIAIMLILFGVGVAIVLLCCLCLLALTSLGIISSAVLYGLYKKSFLSGFRALVIAASTIFTGIFSAVSSSVINEFFHISSTRNVLVLGFLFGLVVGFFNGKLANLVLQKVLTFFKDKVLTRSSLS